MKQKKADNIGPVGELHQVAGRGVPTLIDRHGTPAADDRSSLRVGARGPAGLADSHRESVSYT